VRTLAMAVKDRRSASKFELTVQTRDAQFTVEKSSFLSLDRILSESQYEASSSGLVFFRWR